MPGFFLALPSHLNLVDDSDLVVLGQIAHLDGASNVGTWLTLLVTLKEIIRLTLLVTLKEIIRLTLLVTQEEIIRLTLLCKL